MGRLGTQREFRPNEMSRSVRAVLAGTVVVVAAAAAASASPAPLPDMEAVASVVGAPAVWRAGGTGQGIDVAVLDTGVTPVPGLDRPDKIVYGPDLSFDSQDPTRAYLDGYGHGTAMAGIIAGNDGTPGGYRGIAPDARIVSVKVGSTTGAADVSQMIAGIDWVVEHAHDPGMNIRVLNLSLGTSSIQPYVLDPLAHAAEVAWRKGIVVVVAIGNDGTSMRTVANPASDPFLIAVGAADPMGTIDPADDVVPGFSQRGTFLRHADVVAPGVSVMGLAAPGSTLVRQYPGAVHGGRFFRGSGTSQAAAVTSGAVADLLSLRPELTPNQVKELLTSTAVKIETRNSIYAGSGEISVARAMSAPTPSAWASAQWFLPSTGLGSLELARGADHVSLDGVPLTGDRDIFGRAWSSPAMAAAEERMNAWNGGVYNGATWSGATWSGATWSGATWSGATWSGATWSGATWSGATWSGATWSGAAWA